MTLDSSALVAIVFAEAGHLGLIDRILAADQVRITAPTLVETGLVVAGRRRASDVRDLDGLVQELGITVVPFGEREWHTAIDAFLRFGRGRHKAALSFGDCLAYASAVTANDALLFVGDHFAQTDVTPA